jgi:hypothetical protein
LWEDGNARTEGDASLGTENDAINLEIIAEVDPANAHNLLANNGSHTVDALANGKITHDSFVVINVKAIPLEHVADMAFEEKERRYSPESIDKILLTGDIGTTKRGVKVNVRGSVFDDVIKCRLVELGKRLVENALVDDSLVPTSPETRVEVEEFRKVKNRSARFASEADTSENSEKEDTNEKFHSHSLL